MKTRSKPKSGSKSAGGAPSSETSSKKVYPLPKADLNPPHLLVLPKRIGRDAVVVTLPHPRTGERSRYFFCPETGFYEFKSIAAGVGERRSWILDGSGGNQTWGAQNSDDDVVEVRPPGAEKMRPGYIVKSSTLMTVTPLDPLFLLLPVLAPSVTGKSEKETLFLTFEDHLEKIAADLPHLKVLIDAHPAPLQTFLEPRLAAVCDSVSAGDENMYRISMEKLAAELVKKAQKAASAFPASMDQKFVQRPLEPPVMCEARTDIARDDPNASNQEKGEADAKSKSDGESLSLPSPSDSSKNSASESSSFSTGDFSNNSQASSLSTAKTTPIEGSPAPSQKDSSQASDSNGPSAEITSLQRLRISLDYILGSYIPAALATAVNKHISSSSSSSSSIPTFAPLTAYLARLNSLREEAAATRSVGDFSRKRAAEDEEAMEEQREKKRLKEEEEAKRKKNESRGVRDLKKADRTGMKSLAEMWGKKAAVKKA